MDPIGHGVWVETKFRLDDFIGQRIQVRWIGTTWVFDSVSSYYYTEGWGATQQDDGWWLDNIQVTGTVTRQITPLPDQDPTPPATCPAGCDATVGDRGTSVILDAADLAGRPIDGVTKIAVAGESLRVSAAGSSLPGGCPDGTPQFRFFRDGVVVQDWSGRSFLQDAPESDATYTVRVRCSTDFDCTSAQGATVTVRVYRGDGADILLSTEYVDQSGVTRLIWPARPQAEPMSGYDVYRGTMSDDGDTETPALSDPGLATLTPLECDVPNGTPGTEIAVSTPETPATGGIHYYLVGHSSPVTGSRSALGTDSAGRTRIAPLSCP